MGRIPRFLQIAHAIREKISNGEWAIGSKLPTQKKLSEHFQVNRSTVITAIEMLKAEGLLEGKTGSGIYVINNRWSLLHALSPPDWNALSRWAVHPPSDVIVQMINEYETKNEFIHLSKGEIEPGWFPREEAAEIVGKIAGQAPEFGYGDGAGDWELRKELSSYVKKRGIHASPANILIVSGALQAVTLISLGMLKRGSTIFIENPSYLYSVNLFESAGMTLKPIEMKAEGLDVKQLTEQRILDNLAALYINPTFQNPTGISMPLQQREHLIEACQYHQLPIIEDDIYRDLWIDERPPLPVKALDRQGQVLYVGSFSKTISASLRIGWLIGPEDVIRRLSDVRMQMDYGSSYLPQIFVKELLASGLYEQHIRKVRSELRKKRDFLLDLLERHLREHATWTKPDGGFFVWLNVHQEIKMKQMFRLALKKGILINPGFIYNEQNPTIRLSYSYPSLADMEKGIVALKQLMESM